MLNYVETNEQIFQEIASSTDADQGIKSGIPNLDDVVRLDRKGLQSLQPTKTKVKRHF